MRIAVLLLVARVAAAEPADPVHLRLGTSAIDGSQYMLDMQALADRIAVRTHHAVELDWINDGRLGDEAAIAELVSAGKLDGAGLSEAGLQRLDPSLAAVGAPGRFRSYADVDAAKLAFHADGITLAMWADLGFAHVYSLDPIAAIPELARPITRELTAQIAAGRVRTWALPPLYMAALGTQLARYASTLHYRYVIGGLVFSSAALARLSPAQRDALLDVCRTAEPKLRASWRALTDRGTATLGKAGVRYRAPTADEIAAFFQR